MYSYRSIISLYIMYATHVEPMYICVFQNIYTCFFVCEVMRARVCVFKSVYLE